MAIKLSIDPKLMKPRLNYAARTPGEAAVTKAIEEFIARRRQKRLLDLVGELTWQPYGYKAERGRH